MLWVIIDYPPPPQLLLVVCPSDSVHRYALSVARSLALVAVNRAVVLVGWCLFVFQLNNDEAIDQFHKLNDHPPLSPPMSEVSAAILGIRYPDSRRGPKPQLPPVGALARSPCLFSLDTFAHQIRTADGTEFAAHVRHGVRRRAGHAVVVGSIIRLVRVSVAPGALCFPACCLMFARGPSQELRTPTGSNRACSGPVYALCGMAVLLQTSESTFQSRRCGRPRERTFGGLS